MRRLPAFLLAMLFSAGALAAHLQPWRGGATPPLALEDLQGKLSAQTGLGAMALLTLGLAAFFAILFSIGLAYVQQGNITDALREFQIALDLLGGRGRTSFTLAELGYAYARFGRRDDALRILRDLKARLAQGDPNTRAVHLAILCAGLGETDEALGWLAKAYEERDNLLTILRVYPFFDSLRSDPRFTDLMKKVGL